MKQPPAHLGLANIYDHRYAARHHKERRSCLMRRMEDELQVDDCDSKIRERHKLGLTNMVNISIYSQPELKAL
jgi:hypothetical protein